MARSGDMYKKPGEECEFTPEQAMELLKCAEDPLHFIRNYVKIQHPTLGGIKFDTYDYQDRVLESMIDNRWVILMQPRQTGKSTLIAAYLLWFGCFNKDKTILVASNKNSNAMDIMSRITFMYEELPFWLKPGVKYATMHKLEFDNGSKIESQATTENTGRGMAISLLMLDELAFVPKRVQEDMWTSLAPTLSTGGACIISSTPNGDEDLFAQLWMGAELGTNGFVSEEVKWDEHPDRDEEYKKDMIAKVGKLKWEQEYECQMISSDALLVSSLVLQQMKYSDPIDYNMGFNFWGEFKADKKYYVGVDVSTGSGLDYSVIEVLELPTMKQVAEFRHNDLSIPRLYGMVKWILNKIYEDGTDGRVSPEIYWSFENNGVGAGMTALYENDEKFPEHAMLLSDQNKLGIATTGKNKILTCMELKNLVERTGGLQINSRFLLSELKSYIQKNRSYEAKAGCTDDCVAAMLVVIQMLKKASQYDEEAFDAMYNYSETDVVDGDWTYDDPPPIVF